MKLLIRKWTIWNKRSFERVSHSGLLVVRCITSFRIATALKVTMGLVFWVRSSLLIPLLPLMHLQNLVKCSKLEGRMAASMSASFEPQLFSISADALETKFKFRNVSRLPILHKTYRHRCLESVYRTNVSVSSAIRLNKYVGNGFELNGLRKDLFETDRQKALSHRTQTSAIALYPMF